MNVPRLSYIDADGVHSVVLDRVATSIGRSPDQDIVLRYPFISRRHASILRENSEYTLIDRNSSHGTFLNAVRVERATLKPGDVLQLGSLEGPAIEFHMQPPPQETKSELFSAVTQLLSSFDRFTGDPLSGGPTHSADERRRAAREIEKLNWLLSAAHELNAGGATADILGTLLRLTLQLTGLERGFVFLGEGDGMKFARGLNAEGETLVEDSTVSRQAVRKALAGNARFAVSDTLDDESASAWTSVMANKIRSIYCIPLRKRASASDPNPSAAAAPQNMLGLLYLDSQIGPGYLTEVDHKLLETIAIEASTLLENALLAEGERAARKAREELSIAAGIHEGLMSIDLPVLPYATLQARTVPCSAIGGDFYDAVALEDSLIVTIADVSGKGVPAAIVAATLQGIIHTQLLARQSLPEIAALVNTFLCTRNVGKYATMVLLRIVPDGRIEYLNCGHVPPLCIRGGEVRELAEANMIVGLIPDATYISAYDRVESGERLLLVTDAVTEAENEHGEAFGDFALHAVAPHYRHIDEILEHVARFHAPDPARDDCTVLEVRYRCGP